MSKLPIKALASYTLFSTMYNNGHKNVYDMIAAFIDDVIQRKHLVNFSVSEIAELLEQEFYLYIPLNVIKSSIERLRYLEKSEHTYRPNFSACDNLRHGVRFNDQFITKECAELENELIDYALKQKYIQFNVADKELLIGEFIGFLLNGDKSSSWSALIASFIIEKENNEYFRKKLRDISEGVILYAGITYSSNAAPRHKWRKLKVFLETEILFNITGLNGIIFKEITKELLDLFNELNKRNAERIIELHYFEESKQQIDNYFKHAEMYVKTGKAITVEDSRKAIRYIVSECHHASDVLEKKSLFYQNLAKLNITPFEFDPYSSDNNKYNLEDRELSEKYSIGDDEYKYIKHINYINILRRNKQPNDIADAGAILLTGTAKILRISQGESKYTNAPLAVGIGAFTNKMWYDLQKGFTHGIPKAFDMIVRAKIALSSILGDELQERYSQIVEEYQKGKYTQEQLVAFRSEIIDECKRPDDIEIDKIDDVMINIYNKDINQYILERTKLEEENIRLKVVNQEGIERELSANRRLRLQEVEILEMYNEKRDVIVKEIAEMEFRRKKSKRFLNKSMKSIDILILVLVATLIVLVMAYSEIINDTLNGKLITGVSLTIVLWLIKKIMKQVKIINKVVFWLLGWRCNLKKQMRNILYKKHQVDIIRMLELKRKLRDIDRKIKKYNL